jgi:hypothetical protein
MTDELNTHEEQGESQAHIDAMIAKGEQLEANNNPDKEERPDWLPEKFKDPAQMANAYAELEKKLGQGKSTGDVEETQEESVEATPDAAPEASEVREAVEAAGVNFDSLQGEYDETGGLSDDAYTKLADAGFSQDLVDSWIQGQEALANNYQTAVYESVGGEESYQQMTSWAGDNLSQTEIAAFDRAVGSGDIDMVKLAVQGLQSKYQAAEGTDPSLIEGQSSNSTGGVYSSWAEVTMAMRDPRYQSDPAYRQSVTSKLERSNVQ